MNKAYYFSCYEYYYPFDISVKEAIEETFEVVHLTVKGEEDSYYFRFLIYETEIDGLIQTINEDGVHIAIPTYKTIATLWGDTQTVWTEVKNSYITSLPLCAEENYKKLLIYATPSKEGLVNWIHNIFPNVVKTMIFN